MGDRKPENHLFSLSFHSHQCFRYVSAYDVLTCKGGYLYDVCSGCWEGVESPKADIVKKLSKGGCVNLWTRGSWEGVKKSQNFADVI